ncbi:hypothetical protein KM927_27945 [Priestia megaterium]|uniref:hypothetical protein n=1 Tax=Priestia megaterium TaxID=1404 RepID=UPI001C235818|nr:hypothetical protein [Priestia megaterium]MBU8757305.1 hypothetical protein [Priestia megaterium]
MEKLVYKGKTYSLEDLKKDYANFLKGLENHNDFTEYHTLAISLETYDPGYARAGDRIYALHELLLTAKYNLFNSYKKIHNDVLNQTENYFPHAIRRSHYLKNAIVWYNSCQDYVFQLISLSYDLHEVEITSTEKYKLALRNCSYIMLKEKLRSINTENSRKLLRIINKYGSDRDVKYLREELANNLKHHGNLGFRGIYVDKPFGYTERNYHTGEVTYSSEWKESDIVDIDETIDLLKRVHNLFVKHVREVINFIDFKACIPTGEKALVKGKSYWVTKEKHEYRKILC